MADDLLFQNISTVQNKLQPTPRTILAASTISPDTFLSVIAGSTAITTIVPPVTGTHLLALVFSATTGTITGGTTANTVVGDVVPVQNVPVFLTFDPRTEQYYAK